MILNLNFAPLILRYVSAKWKADLAHKKREFLVYQRCKLICTSFEHCFVLDISKDRLSVMGPFPAQTLFNWLTVSISLMEHANNFRVATTEAKKKNKTKLNSSGDEKDNTDSNEQEKVEATE